MRPLVTLVLIVFISHGLLAQSTADPELLSEIGKIKAIDNHAHPLRYVAAGDKADDEYDALPLDGIEPFSVPVRLSLTNPEFIGAWRDLFAYGNQDMSEAHVRELVSAKQRVIAEQGENYPTWVLEKLNIETMFANRIAMGKGLNSPRFRWVSFVDAFLFPLSNANAKKSNRDYAVLYPLEEKLLQRYLRESQQPGLPLTLDEYLRRVVTATLERQKRNGAIAVKFEAAYLRLLDFDPANERNARITYARFVKGGEPATADYKNLQDFIFHYIAAEAGRLGLAVHIHAVDGFGGYYRQTGSNPELLESTFNDPTLRQTNFVIIHGGYPFTKQTKGLLSKPNVYADFSNQTFVIYPRELSAVLRNWLESYPDKILFGTDAFSFTPAVDWPEVAWLSSTSARQALALALTEMMHDGEVSRTRAIELARMALHDNAAKLYKLN